MVESGYDPNVEPEEPRIVNPEAEAIAHGAETFPTPDGPEENAPEPEIEAAPQVEAEAEAEVEAGDEAVEPGGPGIAAKVLSGTMAAASFAAVRGAGLVYNYPRSALAAGLSVVVLGGVLMVRPNGGGKAPVAQIPPPAAEKPGDEPDEPVKTTDARPKAEPADEDVEPEETLPAPAPVADLAEPAPAIEAESVDDDELPAVDAVRLTSGGSALDLPALPDLGAEAAAPAPTMALAAANLKLGDEPEDDKADPAPAPEPTTETLNDEPAPAPAPEPVPALEDDGEAPAPAPDPAPIVPLPVEAEPAPDLDSTSAPAPAPAIGEDHGLLELPSLDDHPAAPAVDPVPELKPDPKTEAKPEPPPEAKPEPKTEPEPASKPEPTPEAEAAIAEPPQVDAPEPGAGPAAGLGAGLSAALGALTGSAPDGPKDDAESKPADPVPSPAMAPPAADEPPPLSDLDQAPAPPAEPAPAQSAPAVSGGLPDFRAVPSPAPAPATSSSGFDAPTPAPATSPLMEDEKATEPEPDEPDREGWVTIKRSSSAAYMLRDLDRDEPGLYDDDFGPLAPGPNPDPDAHADKAVEFEIHQPYREEPRAAAASSAADEGRMDTVLHTVRPGENFWTISRTYYTSGRYYRALGQANADQFKRLEDLYVGAVIRVPPPEDLDPAYIDPPPSRADRDQNPLVAETNSQSRAATDDDFLDADEGSSGVPIRRAGRSELELHLPIADPRAERVSDDPSRESRFLDEPEIPARRGAPRPVHKVRPRETLRTIARDRLGDARRADEILELNRQVIDDPHRLIVGQILDLPDDARTARAR